MKSKNVNTNAWADMVIKKFGKNVETVTTIPPKTFVTIGRGKRTAMSVSRCAPLDKFNYSVGVAVALAKHYNQYVPI